jgi:NADH-quinone oxidoreductase subunit J
METIIFYILAAVVVISSFLTISTKNILRAAIYLLFVLCATAGIYFMMNFNFLAAVQLTVYAGGIVVLIIFSILLTHQIDTRLELPTMKKRVVGGVISVLTAIVFLWALGTYTFKTATTEIADTGIRTIGFHLMNYKEHGYVLPFEVISVLLLVIMIAAIIIAKKFSHD